MIIGMNALGYQDTEGPMVKAERCKPDYEAIIARLTQEQQEIGIWER